MSKEAAKAMSKKEEQRLKKEAKKEQSKRRERMQSMGIKILAVVLIPLVLYVFYQGLFGGAPVYAPSEVAETDHVLGNPDAPLTITMYADFQCPACASQAGIIEEAWSRIANNVRLVYRYFPLDTYRNSFLAARYAEAAAAQDSFWGMHDALFFNQPLWANEVDARSVFDGFAMQLGLDMEQLQADLDRDAARQKILADQQGGIRAGVRSTPTLFFNGEMVRNPGSAGQLVTMVNQHLLGE